MALKWLYCIPPPPLVHPSLRWLASLFMTRGLKHAVLKMYPLWHHKGVATYPSLARSPPIGRSFPPILNMSSISLSRMIKNHILQEIWICQLLLHYCRQWKIRPEMWFLMKDLKVIIPVKQRPKFGWFLNKLQRFGQEGKYFLICFWDF